MNARTRRSTTLAMLGALAGVLALFGGVADGEVTHEYLSQITEVPAGSGASFIGPLGSVDTMTVDAGKLYVAEGGGESSRLNKFDTTSKTFTTQFPHVASLYSADSGVAVDHATGEVYVGADEVVEEGLAGVVGAFKAAGSLQATWKGADTPNARLGCLECGSHGDVAVDNSTSVGDWAAGDVYVASPTLGVVDVFKPAAGGGETYVTQLTGTGPGSPFGAPRGVALDPSGRVLVLDGGGVDVFEPTVLNEYAFVQRIAGTPSGPLEAVRGLAVDGGNGDIYILSELGLIDQFNSAGVYLGHLTGDPNGGFAGLSSAAVDPSTHDLYVGTQSQGQGVVDIFGASVVIPDVTTTVVSGLKPRSVTLRGTVNPDSAGAATCQFNYGTTTGFGTVAPCATAVPSGGSPVAVQAQVTGLQPDTTYYYRLEATNANGTNPGEATQNQEFHTTGPAIQQESASVVTSTSSTLHASIDPNNTTTTYYFQYGTSTAYGTDLPGAPGVSLGAGSGYLTVNVHLQNLAADTTYHYRVAAVSEPGGEPITVSGPDKTFTTQAAGTALVPPDGRAWEMVTPPNKQGAGIYAIGYQIGDDIQAAEDGGGITFAATAPFVENPAGNVQIETSQVLSTRLAPGSWETQDITTPHNDGAAETFAVSHASEYIHFSPDLSQAFVEPDGHTALPPLPAGSEKTVYLREANGAFNALVTAANVPPGTHFGGNEGNYGDVIYRNSTPDLRHIVLEERVPLTPTPLEECGTVLWTAGNLSCTGGQVSSARHAISNDGSRVIGTEFQGHNGLSLRDLSTGETVQLDAAQGAPEPEADTTTYVTANTAGSRVFFTSTQRLTADATASPSQNLTDLYEFEVTSAAGGPLAGHLTDLTVDVNPSESAAVQGVIGASEDGSYVYFVAVGVLGDGPAHDATNGRNLYVAHYDEATHGWDAPHFIASLSSEDAPSWASFGDLTYMTARVSPNGRHLAFMSDRSLTGYDNTDASSGAADEEVYLFDASLGRLVCASCDPTDARPAGLHVGGGYLERLVDYPQIWGGRWLAGSIPGWTPKDITNAIYQSRYLSDDGRLFFNSSDALVSADVNGKEDVYEYEPVGLGSCQPPDYGQSASVVFSEAMGGCVGLISAGTSSEESAFIDASSEGGDVFFLTLSKLSPQDYDTSLDLYDAHVCTASAPCAPPAAVTLPPCASGDSCKPAPTPQPEIFGAPASQTFSGAGNVSSSGSKTVVKPRSTTQKQKLSSALKACRKKSRHSRGACERRARRRYAAKPARTGNSLSARTRR